MTRISGYGGGQGTGPGGQGGRHRADLFRARHRIGERLRGRILRQEPGGLTLVEVDGQELSARLEIPAEPGATLLFLVRALLPEIHLQALQGPAAQPEPATLLQQFRSARERFEQHAGQALSALPLTLPPSPEPTPAFQALLALDPAAAELFGAAQALLEQLDADLARPRGLCARYTPWCAPGLRRCEALLKLPGSPDRSFFELTASGHLERYGQLELRLVGRGPRHHLRLFLEHGEHAEEVAGLVREALGPAAPDAEGLSLGRLPAPAPGGVFTELLADPGGGLVSSSGGGLGGGLNARV